MSNVTPLLDQSLKKHNAHRSHSHATRLSVTDEFLKEAYRIESSISSLSLYLRSIRQSYLTTSQTRRRPYLPRPTSTSSSHHHSTSTLNTPNNNNRKHLTNTQKDQIDADARSALRDANASIRQLADAELLRQRTELRIAQEKKGRNAGFRALSRWAAGGGGGIGQAEKKSAEEEMEDAIRNTTRAHREGVIWFLDWRLGEVARLQRDMMETRLEREIERSKSALYKTRGSAGVGVVAAASDEMGLGLGLDASSANGSAARANATTSFAQRQGKVTANKIAMAEDDAQRQKILDGLSTEQLQMFEQENSDMLRQYEETLDQVRTAERSIQEIAELHSTLTQNLDVQSAHISQLVADAQHVDEDLRGGNRELKRATERKSTARMVFFASCGLSAFLVVWDLVF